VLFRGLFILKFLLICGILRLVLILKFLLCAIQRRLLILKFLLFCAIQRRLMILKFLLFCSIQKRLLILKFLNGVSRFAKRTCTRLYGVTSKVAQFFACFRRYIGESVYKLNLFLSWSCKWYIPPKMPGCLQTSRIETNRTPYNSLLPPWESHIQHIQTFVPRATKEMFHITVVTRSKARNSFTRSNTGIMGSNPARCVVLCIRIPHLSWSWS
jgi:hypothetical protein